MKNAQQANELAEEFLDVYDDDSDGWDEKMSALGSKYGAKPGESVLAAMLQFFAAKDDAPSVAGPPTIAGIPVRFDPTMQPNSIELQGPKGRMRIENIGGVAASSPVARARVEEVLRNRTLFIGGPEDAIPQVATNKGVQIYTGCPNELIEELCAEGGSVKPDVKAIALKYFPEVRLADPNLKFSGTVKAWNVGDDLNEAPRQACIDALREAIRLGQQKDDPAMANAAQQKLSEIGGAK